MYLKTEKEAMREANKVLKILKGEGWEIRVWENLGWHFSIINGPLSLNYSMRYKNKKEVRYWCLLDDADRGSCGIGSCFWLTKEQFEDPNDAVENQMELAMNFVNRISRLVYNLEGRLGVKKGKEVDVGQV